MPDSRLHCLVLPLALAFMATPCNADDQGEALLSSIQERAEQVAEGRGGRDYLSTGRRDPFADPMAPVEAPEPADSATGLAAQRVAEVRLTGLSHWRGDGLAILLGTDGIGYSARAGTELLDGVVVRVGFDQRHVVFRERVSDPTQTVRTREVIRLLEPGR